MMAAEGARAIYSGANVGYMTGIVTTQIVILVEVAFFFCISSFTRCYLKIITIKLKQHTNMDISLSRLYKALLPHGFILYFRKKDIEKYDVKPIDLTFFSNQQARFYSQSGEDILLRLFCEKEEGYKGFYVDIGAYHPNTISNTKYFYEKGWRGINIDANPSSIKEFNKERKGDINIQSGVSDSFGELNYYYFGESDAINTFNKTQSEKFEKLFERKVKEVMTVNVQPVNYLLEKNLPEGQRIDFITMDVEGFEMRILKSFDFEKYAPDFFLIEDLEYANKRFAKFQTSPTCIFFKEKGYIPVAKTHMTVLFKKIV